MFQVKAFRKSAIIEGESEWLLTPVMSRNTPVGYVFINRATGYTEQGSFSANQNKFECLDRFKKISGDMPVRFELS